METTYHLTTPDAPVGKPLKILERDARTGQLIGEYIGYRNAQRRIYTLYPRYNPYAAKNGQLRRHEVSELLVKYP